MRPHTTPPLVRVQHLVDHQIVLETREPSVIGGVELVLRSQQGHAVPLRGRVGEFDLVRLPGRGTDVDEARVQLGEGGDLRGSLADPVSCFFLAVGGGAVEIRGPVPLPSEGRVQPGDTVHVEHVLEELLWHVGRFAEHAPGLFEEGGEAMRALRSQLGILDDFGENVPRSLQDLCQGSGLVLCAAVNAVWFEISWQGDGGQLQYCVDLRGSVGAGEGSNNIIILRKGRCLYMRPQACKE